MPDCDMGAAGSLLTMFLVPTDRPAGDALIQLLLLLPLLAFGDSKAAQALPASERDCTERGE